MADPMIQLDPAEILADGPSDDVNMEPVEAQDTTAADSSPEESKSPEVVADQPQGTEGESTDQSDEGQSEDAEPPAEETPEDEKPLTGAEKRKAELTAEIEEGKQQLGIDPNAEIRDLVSARNAIRQAVEARTSQAYAPQSIDEIMQQTGQDELNARLTAMEQRNEFKEWNDRVVDAQLTLGTESQRVINEFSIFNPASPDFQADLAAEAAQVLEANIIRDTNVPELDALGRPTGKGMIVGFRATPYQIYKPIADAHTRALARAEQTRVEAQIQGQRSAEKMMASAEPASSAVPKEPEEDPFFTGLTKGLNLSR